MARWKLYIVAGLVVGLLWWRWRTPAVRVKKALDIDANVYSPTFGEPMTSSVFAPQPAKSDVAAAIEESNAAIAGYDVPANPWGIS